MRKSSRRLAVSSMMTALAVTAMLLGSVIPAATFCCPAVAGLMLVPVAVECGRRMAVGAWLAIAALSLILCPDKEAALLFAFAGWYPVAKWRLDAIRSRWLRPVLKLLLLDAALGLMALTIWYVLRMDEIMADYAEMTRAVLIAFIVLGNITLLLYDRLLGSVLVVYVRKLRPRLFGQGDR